MAEITAKEVQALRKKTGAGILDCRRALEESGGDQEAAERLLREKGIISAAKRQGRERTEGAVAVVVHGGRKPGRGDRDARVRDGLRRQVARFRLARRGDRQRARRRAARSVLAQFSDRIENLGVILKENIALGRTVRFEAPERRDHRQLPAPAERSWRERRARRARRRQTRRSPTTSRFTSPSPVRSTCGARTCPPSRSRTSARRRRRSPATRASRKPRWTRSSRAACRAGTKSGSCSISRLSATRSRPSPSCSASAQAAPVRPGRRRLVSEPARRR